MAVCMMDSLCSIYEALSSERLFLYLVILLILAVLIVLEDKLWYSQYALHISRSRLLTCRSCGHVFLQRRQQLSRRCPLCGAPANAFRLPYSGVHEKLRDRAKQS